MFMLENIEMCFYKGKMIRITPFLSVFAEIQHILFIFETMPHVLLIDLEMEG